MRRLLPAALVVFALPFVSAGAKAADFGEISRFGEPAPTVGVKEFFVGNGKIAPSFKHLIGVDSEDNSAYVLEEPRQSEEIEEGAQEGEFRHWYRVQKFDATGKFVVESPIFEVVTAEQEEEEGEETEEDVQGIAVDPGAKTLYFLINEDRAEGRSDEEIETAGYLFALSTTTLEGAAGTTNGVLAGPEALKTESKEISQPLLEPRGITVDPAKHEVIILAEEDEKKEEKYHWVLQRVTPAGALGERYVDTKDFLYHRFEEAGTKQIGGAPASPVVTSAGKVLVEDNFERIVKREDKFFPEAFLEVAEIPASFASATGKGEEPTAVIDESRELTTPRVAESEGYEYGGSLAASPEGNLYQRGNVEDVLDGHVQKPGVLIRSASTGAVSGWTGGRTQTSAGDACSLEPGVSESPLPVVAAGKEGKLFVLAGEYLKPSGEGLEEYKSHAAVIVFGPSGSGCAGDTVGTIVAKEGASQVSEPLQGLPVSLSLALTGGDVVSAKWTIEHEGKKEELPFTSQRTQETGITHKFEASGEFKITVKGTSDNLVGPTEFESTRTLKVKGEPVKPAITEQPNSVSVPAGGEATFKASASGPPETAEWLVSCEEGKAFEKDTIDAGHNTNTLKVKASKADNGCRYEAVFKNSKGEATSEPATLTVTLETFEPLSIAEQPVSQSAAEGATVSFKAGAKGVPAPTVQWQVSTNGGAFSVLSGRTQTTLTLTKVSASQSGNEYRAVFDQEGTDATTNPATLTVSAVVVSPPPAPGPGSEPPAPGSGGVEHEHVVAPKAIFAGVTFSVPSSGAIPFKVSCATGATTCDGTIVLKTATAVSASPKARKKILTVGTVSFTLTGGGSKTLTLHLSAAGRKLLARSHTLRLKATITSHDTAGEKIVTTRTITLKPAMKKR
jgi:hypothetical protein